MSKALKRTSNRMQIWWINILFMHYTRIYFIKTLRSLQINTCLRSRSVKNKNKNKTFKCYVSISFTGFHILFISYQPYYKWIWYWQNRKEILKTSRQEGDKSTEELECSRILSSLVKLCLPGTSENKTQWLKFCLKFHKPNLGIISVYTVPPFFYYFTYTEIHTELRAPLGQLMDK